jgi:hypothetical protein
VPSRKVEAQCSTYTVWSKNNKWSGSNSEAQLYVSKRAVQTLGVNGLIIGGLITLDAKKVGHREYQAVRAVQGRGVALNEESGYIIRGYHVVADSLAKARKAVARKRSAAAAKLTAMRVEQTLEKDSEQTLWDRLENVSVTRQDSLRGGNCAPGTDTFIARHGLDERNSVPARELLTLEKTMFTRRAIAAAIARQKVGQQRLAQAA